ncbi:hypothetical protein [Mucilaginibacter sp. L196]|uniref:hypothetical protein n=1 Tax=Mucilaginibacter sp. L196 TaxID=1641870 RepID=UPI00131EBEA3|nr:hypothetical protein [Mucilaginibacter sp. L196]
MKNEQDKKLDDLFKKRLENPDEQSGYREEDWDALENMLDKRKRKIGIVYLLPILSSVAALMLVFVGWWFFEQKANRINHQQKSQITKVAAPKIDNNTLNNKTHSKNNEGQLPKPQIVQPTAYIAKIIQGKAISNGVVISKTNINSIKNDSLNNKASVFATSAPNTNKSKDSVFEQAYTKNHPLYKGSMLSPQTNNSNNWIKNEQIVALNHVTSPVDKATSPVILDNNNVRNNIASVSTPQPTFNPPATVNTSAVQKQPVGNGKITDQPMTAAEKSNAAMMKLLESTSPANNNKLSAKTQASFKPRFVGGVIGAQDINGAGSFKQGKVGSKAGLVFAAGVSQKLTISTGAVYSSTPYSAGYDNFTLPYQPKVSPVSLTANCQMLDIPINIGYQVYNQGKNMISFGTGLSSYIMLQQDYNFVYSSSSGIAPKDYSVPNSSSYLFKILNLNATYERQISSKAGITIQPYLKLPLADIGYSQVKLQTTGIAVGLSWNLDSSQP